jgi:hypothetical protein
MRRLLQNYPYGVTEFLGQLIASVVNEGLANLCTLFNLAIY